MALISTRAEQRVKEKDFSTTSFLALIWTFTGVATLLSLGRFVVRKQTIGKFYWDDCTHGFAAIVLIVFSVVCSKLYPLIQEIGLYEAQEGPKPSSAALERFLRFEFAAILLFFVVIYTVKATFLLFYRQLFGVSRMFTRYWWAVTMYTVVCFLASFLSAFWTCETPGRLFALSSCFSAKASIIEDHYAEVTAALNISSDIAVMVLPLWMLKGLQITTGKRLGLVVVFSIGVVVIVLDVCRLALGIGGGVKQQASNFDALEPTVAVIVSALPVYRALLPSAGRSSRRKARHQYTSYGSDKSNWRGRIRSRQGKEAYELSEDSQNLHPDLTKPVARHERNDVASETKITASSAHRDMRKEELV